MPQLRKLAGQDCDDVVSCPAVYVDEGFVIHGNDVVVQGDQVVDDETLDQVNLGPGEVALRLPADLILAAAQRLRENS